MGAYISLVYNPRVTWAKKRIVQIIFVEMCHFVLNLGLIFYSFLLGVCDGEVLGLCDGTSDGEVEGVWDGAVPQIYFCKHIS